MAAIAEKEMLKTLGDRMKEYEDIYEHRVIPAELPFIVRLDGNSFSKFTGFLKKPFDERFSRAMILTMNDLVSKFNAATGYTHSDEITLVFRPMSITEEEIKNKTRVHIYNGRLVKICTIMAGFCSVAFYRRICKEVSDEEILEKIYNKLPFFDCRLLVFPKNAEIANHMIWRSCYDCKRNSTSTFARYVLPKKVVFKKNTTELQKEMLNIGFNIKDVHEYYTRGVVAKKELYQCKMIHPKTKKDIEVTRKRIINKTGKFDSSNEIVEMLLDKYWTDTTKFYPIEINSKCLSFEDLDKYKKKLID